MSMRRVALVAAAAAAFPLVVGSASAAGVSDADRTFLTKEVQGARYELALAQTAQAKAATPQVRSYARMIVHDHEKANVALMQLVKQEGVEAPGGMDAKDEKTLAKLKGMSGPGFDKAYLDEVTRINAQDETDADHEKSSTKDLRIGAYIKKFSAMDANHKKMGESLKRSGA